MRPQFNIARAFKDGEEVALHVATLEGPNEHYNVQIVKHVRSGNLLVRKTTHTRRRVGFKVTEAQAHFNKDIMAARYISQAYDAGTQGNARFAQLYVVNTIQPDILRHGSKLTMVSYWSFCNGTMVDGGLERFMDRCNESGVSLPDGLIIRFAWNMLESLLSDLPLHFRFGNELPDLCFADFGDCEKIPAEGSLADEGGDEWDIPRVKLMISYLYHRRETVQNRNTGRRLRRGSATGGHMQLVRDGAKDDATPLQRLYKILNDLDTDFDGGKVGFPPLASTSLQAPAGFSILPRLRAAINFANQHAMHAYHEGSSMWKRLSGWERWNGEDSSAIPTFDSVHAMRREKLRGPWYAALVDKNTNGLVSIDQSRTYHTPKNESIDEETDYESDDEVSEASDLE